LEATLLDSWASFVETWHADYDLRNYKSCNTEIGHADSWDFGMKILGLLCTFLGFCAAQVCFGRVSRP